LAHGRPDLLQLTDASECERCSQLFEVSSHVGGLARFSNLWDTQVDLGSSLVLEHPD